MIESDKYYWHKYLQEYERLVFSKMKNPTAIMEFGVLRGASIALLADRFPNAKIIGVDKSCSTPEWPTSDNISYVRLDQGNRESVRDLFSQHWAHRQLSYDLIIDDCSHIPQHQAICLVEALKYVNDGGFYIIEDAHTSHPKMAQLPTNVFHILLCIQHLKDAGLDLSAEVAERLTKNSYFVEHELRALFARIGEITLYKRTSLPIRCYMCKGQNFDYVNLKCSCSVSLYDEFDSMAFIIRMKF